MRELEPADMTIRRNGERSRRRDGCGQFRRLAVSPARRLAVSVSMTLNKSLRLAFFVPPPDQRVGGLDLAINTLREALQATGLTVEIDPAHIDNFDIVHFHGLWQPRFISIAKDCRRSRKPYIVSPHGMLEPWAWRHRWWKKWPYYQLIEQRYLSRAHALVATAASEAGRL